MLLAGTTPPAAGKTFAFRQPTLAKDLASADLVVFGALSNGNAEANDGRGTTELEIIKVLKDHPSVKNQKQLTIKRYVATNDKAPLHVVCFAKVAKGEIDFYRGVRCQGKNDDELLGYLEQNRKLAEATRGEELAFYLKHLRHRHPEIASDAYGVFHNATYADLKLAAQSCDPKQLETQLADKDTADYLKDLYSVLLVLCQRAHER